MKFWVLSILVFLSLPGFALEPAEYELDMEFAYGICEGKKGFYFIDYDNETIFQMDDDGNIDELVSLSGIKGTPTSLCYDKSSKSLYVVSRNSVWEVDVKDESYNELFEVENVSNYGLTGLEFDGENFYICNRFEQNIKVYSEAGIYLRTIDLPIDSTSYRDITLYDNSLWVVNSSKRIVYKMDPESGDYLGSFFLPSNGEHYRGICHDGTRFWLIDKLNQILKPVFVEDLGYAIKSDPKMVTATVNVQLTAKYSEITADVYFPVPPEMERQQILSIDYSSDVTANAFDQYGQEFSRLSMRIPYGQSKTAFMTVNAVLWSIRYSQNAVDEDAEIPSDIASLFTKQVDQLTMNSPLLKEIAAGIEAEATNFIHKIYLTRIAVFDRVSYSMDGSWDNAETVLRNGQGSCSEYSTVFAALCRLNGIPVKMAGTSRRSTAETNGNLLSSTDEVFHRFPLVYLPGVGWAPIDANSDDDADGEYTMNRFLAYKNTHLIFSQSFFDSDILGTGYLYDVEASGSYSRERWVDWTWTDDYYEPEL